MRQLYKKILSLLIISMELHGATCLWESVSGPFYGRLERISKCSDVGKDTIKVVSQIKRLNFTHSSLTMNLSLPFDLNNDVKLHVTVKRHSSTGHYRTVFSMTSQICDLFNTYMPKFVKDIVVAAGKRYKCPIEKGDYIVKPYIVHFTSNEEILFSTWEYGDYLVEDEFYKLNDKHQYVREACLALQFQIRPLSEIKQ